MALAKNKALNVPVTLLIGSTSYEVSMKSVTRKQSSEYPYKYWKLFPLRTLLPIYMVQCWKCNTNYPLQEINGHYQCKNCLASMKLCSHLRELKARLTNKSSIKVILSKNLCLQICFLQVTWSLMERLPQTRLGKLAASSTHAELLEHCDGYDPDTNEIKFARWPICQIKGQTVGLFQAAHQQQYRLLTVWPISSVILNWKTTLSLFWRLTVSGTEIVACYQY